jgi:predicted transport protein
VPVTDSFIQNALAAAEKLKTENAGNEANTKALLIEPMLAALGWETANLDHVQREYRVFDGTSLDYALKLDGELRLFVEAKGVTKDLDDKAFISQTINYANNEGVLWCVLTNGLSYRVYKTNEPVAMGEKLLFEVDLTNSEEGSTKGDSAKALQLISRASLDDGTLELWGERVFTDTRVRKALAGLAYDPPKGFIAAVETATGGPSVPRDKLRESLARILDGQQAPSPSPLVAPPKRTPKARPPTGARKTRTVEDHTGGKPAVIVDLFEQLDEYARSMAADVERRILKLYIGYYVGKAFFTVELRRQRLFVYLNLDPSKAPWNDHAMRDVTNVGHFGMGNTEYSLRDTEQLSEVKALIKQAYDETRKGA